MWPIRMSPLPDAVEARSEARAETPARAPVAGLRTSGSVLSVVPSECFRMTLYNDSCIQIAGKRAFASATTGLAFGVPSPLSVYVASGVLVPVT